MTLAVADPAVQQDSFVRAELIRRLFEGSAPSRYFSLVLWPVIAAIYLGKITTWSDPRIAALNPGKKLPSRGIGAIFRSDASGDTYALTSFLSKVSPEWKESVGAATLVNFPVGAGGRGNSGVAGTLSRTPGGIGYISVAYAVQNKLAVASIENAAGTTVTGSLKVIWMGADGSTPVLPSAGTDWSTLGAVSPPAKTCPVLQAPNVFGWAVAHAKSVYVVPVPCSWSEAPTAVVPTSETPMSVLVIPSAGPFAAVTGPS